MKLRNAFVIGFIAISMNWVSCDVDDDNNDSLNEQDRRFISQAAYGNRAEIEMGQLAASKSSTLEVKQFGQMMVTDHTKALNELVIWSSDKEVGLPDELDSVHQQLKTRLMTLEGYAFDTVYMNSQVRDHHVNIMLFEQQVDNGKEQRLKQYAESMAPTLRMHLEEAQTLANVLRYQPQQ